MMNSPAEEIIDYVFKPHVSKRRKLKQGTLGVTFHTSAQTFRSSSAATRPNAAQASQPSSPLILMSPTWRFPVLNTITGKTSRLPTPMTEGPVALPTSSDPHGVLQFSNANTQMVEANVDEEASAAHRDFAVDEDMDANLPPISAGQSPEDFDLITESDAVIARLSQDEEYCQNLAMDGQDEDMVAILTPMTAEQSEEDFNLNTESDGIIARLSQDEEDDQHLAMGSQDYYETDEEIDAMHLPPYQDEEEDPTPYAAINSKSAGPRKSPSSITRNLRVTLPFKTRDFIFHKGLSLRTMQDTVELKNGDFLRIVEILEDISNGSISLRGWKFQRTRCMYGLLEKKLNEVCWILHVDNDDKRNHDVQAMETVDCNEVLRTRRLRLTNQSFPALSFRGQLDDEEVIEREGQIVCRFKYTYFYPNPKARKSHNHDRTEIMRLRSTDCDRSSDNQIQDEELRAKWRGETDIGGASYNFPAGEKEFLRQEAFSHRGVTIRQSLKGLTHDFPIGDPMERGLLARLVTKQDLEELKTKGEREELAGAVAPTAMASGSFHGSASVQPKLVDLTNPNSYLHPKYTSQAEGRHITHKASGSCSGNLPWEIVDLTRPEQRTFHYIRPLLKANPQSDSTRIVDNVAKYGAEMRKPVTNQGQRRYSFGDCFCGAGGMSRGAVMAGLRAEWGFDFNSAACKSYGSNFYGATVYNVWAHEFAFCNNNLKVDILHLSPSCQFFSGAHTHEGKDDEMNTATLFAIGHLLSKTRPRVVTLEQTAGLVQRHPDFFNALVQMFTVHGFSIHWRLLNCADFGLPQSRLRLFIIASCPGEVLPPFPNPTHHIDGSHGLIPWVTINEAIINIPKGWANHNPDEMPGKEEMPRSGDEIAKCITTSGGGNIHPSGTRNYTLREFACLQSFTLAHKFRGPGIMKQIGNAVPPVVAKAVLEEVKKALRRADGLEES